MENDKYFTCIKCGNRYLKTDLLVHDAKCKVKNYNNYFIQNRNNNFYNNNNNIFKCHICGIEIKLEEKMDHLLCHELEDNDLRENNRQNINYNRNTNLNTDLNTFRNNNINRNINYNRNINNNRINNLADILYNLNFNNNRNRISNERRNSVNYSRRNNASSFPIYNNDASSSESDENEGLDQITIESLPFSRIKDINKLDEEKKKCLICLENFKQGEYTIILPCIHIFHSDCIKKWMEKKNVCPLCKFKIDSYK